MPVIGLGWLLIIFVVDASFFIVVAQSFAEDWRVPAVTFVVLLLNVLTIIGLVNQAGKPS